MPESQAAQRVRHGSVVPPTPAFRARDVVDERIDVCAQFALLAMAKGGPPASIDAAQMVFAVKTGLLAGIYGHDLAVAARLAARLGTTRFRLVPRGAGAALVLNPSDPVSGPPVIVFRKKEWRTPELRVACPDRAALAAALRQVWSNFLAFRVGSFGCAFGRSPVTTASVRLRQAADGAVPRTCPILPVQLVLPPPAATAQPLRDLALDAFFDDEWGTQHPNDSVHFNRFTRGAPQAPVPLTAASSAANPLDRSVSPSIPQPERIPDKYLGTTSDVAIFAPQRLIDAHADRTDPTVAKVTLLFCVQSELNRHGLRSFFARSSDRVLVTVPGREPGWIPERVAWGVGITDAQVNTLLTLARLDPARSQVRVLACYSTGYRGMAGTVNNGLISLKNVDTVVFYDALYRGDDPPPPKGAKTNTVRALETVQRDSPAGVQIITYEVTPGGTPRDGGRLRVPVPTTGLINLKPLAGTLTALILARVLDNGLKDRYFGASEVPRPILNLIAALPRRGTMRSSAIAPPRAGSIRLADWGKSNAADVRGTLNNAGKARALIRKFRLMGWAPPDGEELHDGFVPEFGWEFLAGR